MRVTGPSDMAALIAARVDGHEREALAEARRLVKAGTLTQRIVTKGLAPAMENVDAKCTFEAFNLLEIMLVGRAVSVVADELYPQGGAANGARSTVVIATPEGDVHDLGKNIVRMILVGKGYRVIDLRRNCPVDTLADAAHAEGAKAVLVSGLITTVIPRVRSIKGALRERGLSHVPVIAGGAALKQASPDQLNVDYVAQTAFDGVHYLDVLTAVEGE
jgi:dimethylamine corrinoid protein